MATIKLSALVSDVRGKVGGSVFSRNGGGSYVKTFKKPINPASAKQSAIRGYFATMMTEYRALTAQQINAWASAAYQFPNRVGDLVKVSGASLYIKCNMLLVASGLPRISTPPIVPKDLTEASVEQKEQTAAVFSAVDGSLVEASVTLSSGAAAFKATEYLHLKVSTPCSLGIRSNRSVTHILCPAVSLDALAPVDGTVKVDVTSALKSALGPSIYIGDSSLSVKAGIFDSEEGVLRPIGNVFLALQEEV